MVIALGASSGTAFAAAPPKVTQPTLKLSDGTYHTKALTQETYDIFKPGFAGAQRFAVAANQVDWNVDYPGYNPVNYTNSVVLANVFTNTPNAAKSNIWADGPTPEANNRKFVAFYNNPNLPFSINYNVDTYDRDGNGIKYPVNPFGRTGMIGRGLLGQWGANYAADPMVFSVNQVTGALEILIIVRSDTKQKALPGGIVDPGELVTATAKRELKEETGVEADFSNSLEIYKGYVDDPRNTDNAWMETAAYAVILPDDIAAKTKPVGADDAVSAGFREVSDRLLSDNLYASHAPIIAQARQIFAVVEGPRRVTAMTNAAANFGEVHHQKLMAYSGNGLNNIKSNSTGLSPIVGFSYGKLDAKGSSSSNSRGLKLNNDFTKLDLGLEYATANNLAIGAVLYMANLDGKFALPKANLLESAGKSKIKEFGVNLFGTTGIRENGFMHVTGGVGRLNYEVKREAKFTTNSVSIKGKADGYRYHTGITLGMNTDFEGTSLEPSVGVTYNRVTLHKYHENDIRSVNMNLSSNRNSFKGRVGAKVSRDFEIAGDKSLTPYFKASYAHELVSQPKHVKGTVTSKKIATQYAVDDLSEKGFTLLELGASYAFSQFINAELMAETSVGAKYANLKQVSLSMNFKF